MAYQKPLVEVYQEYANTSVSTASNILYPCIVGPCYHLVGPEINETYALVGTLSRTGMTERSIPGNYPGAEIVESSIKTVVKDISVTVEKATIASATGTSVVVSSTTTEARAGDTVKLYRSDDTTGIKTAKIVSITIGETSITFKLSVLWPTAVTAAGCFMYVLRDITDSKVVAPTVDMTDETLALAPLSVTTTNTRADGTLLFTGSKPVFSAKVYAQYSSLRKDLGDLSTVSSQEDIIAKFGTIAPENPLAFAVNLALSASSVAVKAIGIEEDTFVGYSGTLKTLEASKVYSIVPLSQDASVISLFKNHVEMMSLPVKGMRRIVIGSTSLTTTKELQAGAGVVAVHTEDEPAGYGD